MCPATRSSVITNILGQDIYTLCVRKKVKLSTVQAVCILFPYTANTHTYTNVFMAYPNLFAVKLDGPLVNLDIGCLFY